MDGSSPGRLIGPPAAGCTFGAWSPDGNWIYLTSNAGGANHIWRQRFPDGRPEQLTSGPTEEEGIALSPDGQSFVTAVALRNTSIWLHDASGERPISLEGNAIDAEFTPDGEKLVYKVVTSLGNYPLPGELRIASLDTGGSEVLIPGFQAIDYDISADGEQVVMEAVDREGTSRVWLARLDRKLPPQQIPNLEAKQPRFGPDGDIFFRRPEGAATFVYRVRPDGSGLRKVIEQPVPLLGVVSPDRRWITGWTSRPGNDASAWQAFPLDGRPPLPLGSSVGWNWSADGAWVSVSGGPIGEGRSYLIPLARGEVFPRMPAEGFHTEQEVAQLPGARKVDARTVPGPSPDLYAFYRTTTQRNLYRIPIP
jgi:Tol biopolymer transport system component